MNAFTPYVNKVSEEREAQAQGNGTGWSDDELFDHIAEIINENFVLEVQAGRELED